jgi:hypothetical protein
MKYMGHFANFGVLQNSHFAKTKRNKNYLKRYNLTKLTKKTEKIMFPKVKLFIGNLLILAPFYGLLQLNGLCHTIFYL